MVGSFPGLMLSMLPRKRSTQKAAYCIAVVICLSHFVFAGTAPEIEIAVLRMAVDLLQFGGSEFEVLERIE